MVDEIKLDLKDRKLLYELDLNSRQSFSELGEENWIEQGCGNLQS